MPGLIYRDRTRGVTFEHTGSARYPLLQNIQIIVKQFQKTANVIDGRARQDVLGTGWDRLGGVVVRCDRVGCDRLGLCKVRVGIRWGRVG